MQHVLEEERWIKRIQGGAAGLLWDTAAADALLVDSGKTCVIRRAPPEPPGSCSPHQKALFFVFTVVTPPPVPVCLPL